MGLIKVNKPPYKVNIAITPAHREMGRWVNDKSKSFTLYNTEDFQVDKLEKILIVSLEEKL